MDIGAIWDLIILNPLLNGLVWLTNALFDNFGLSIIILTFVVRGAMYPLTIKQLKATRAMQALQPKIKELQKKYAKDKQKLAEEQMRLYKESGVSASGCLMPMLIQMPIWIALYQSIIRVMAVTPEDFVNLSNRLYDSPVLYSALPVANNFLWLDLSRPDFLLAILVGFSMYAQQKMAAPVTADPAQAAQGRIMSVMLPLMFTFLAMTTFPSGLALFWVVTSIITIVIQYFVVGWGSLSFNFDAINRLLGRDQSLKKRVAEVEKAPAGKEPPASTVVEEALPLPVADTGKPPEPGRSYTGKVKKRRSGKSKRRKRR